MDHVGTDSITGWAFGAQANSQGPRGRSVWVHFFTGGTYLGSTTSNTIGRGDVAAVYGITSQQVGFSWAPPAMAPGTYPLQAYVNDSIFASQVRQLAGQATLVVPAANFVGPSPFGVMEVADAGHVVGWACDPDGGPVALDVFVQITGVGEPRRVATGVTNIPRGGLPCGAGFDIALPAVPGGIHNVFVIAHNQGAGQNRVLERMGGLPHRIAFPFTGSRNQDPFLQYAAGCWYWNGQGSVTTGCPPGVGPLWMWVLFASLQQPPVIPVAGYAGAPARVRYEGLAGGHGLTIKINTYDTLPSLYPWDYNYQGLQTTMPGFNLDVITDPTLEVDLGIRNEQDWFLYDPNILAPLCDPIAPVAGCPHPWLHVLTSVVFLNRDNGHLRFLELVPFHREYSPLFGIGGPPHALNARLPLTDPRVAPYVSVPSDMLVGERRFFSARLRAIAAAVWPGENVDRWMITGGYVGSEQYGRSKVALDVRRFSLQWGFVGGSGASYGTGCPIGAAPQLRMTSPPTIGLGLGLAVDGAQASPIGWTLLGLGFSNTISGGTPLPRDLTPFGMLGCTALADVLVGYLVLGGPTVNQSIPLPLDLSLLGMHLFSQAFVQRDGANIAGVVTSQGMDLQIGG